MEEQLFGTVETARGPAETMLCIDRDQPRNFMVHWWRSDERGAVLASAEADGDRYKLKPAVIYRVSDAGAIFAPPVLTKEEMEWRDDTTAILTRQGKGFSGVWEDPSGVSRPISFTPTPAPVNSLTVRKCSTWGEYKDWAREVTAAGPAWFRGHGCNSFVLRSSLHRAGRVRLERFCGDELQEFTSHAEAVLSRRIDLNNTVEYSTALGLAQHHGVPSPLLDWTLSPYIAAYFAFSDAIDAGASRPKSSHVRVFALSEWFIRAGSAPVVTVTYYKPYVVPIQIAPLHNPRLYAQQGAFLVSNVFDLERFFLHVEAKAGRSVIDAADVPIECAGEALRDLKFMGLTAATLFPGLDGVGRMFRHRMAMQG